MSTARKLTWTVVAFVAVAVLAVALWPRSETGSVAARTRELARELRCVDCEGLSVVDSGAASARDTRRDIAVRLERGESEAEIRRVYVDRHGESILLKPSSDGVGMIVWALPVIALVIAGAGLVLALRRWQHEPRLAATDADEALVARHRAESSEGGGDA